MNIKTLLLTATLGCLGCVATQAANDKYYYDLNGTDAGAGVTTGSSYVWTTNDLYWNDVVAGTDGGGLGTFYLWPDLVGNDPGSAGAKDNVKKAYFSAGGLKVAYRVTIPAGEIRDCYTVGAYKDTVTLADGILRFQDANFSCGFVAYNPGILVLSNLTVIPTNCNLIRFQDDGQFNGRIRIDPTVSFGGKALFINGYVNLDFSAWTNVSDAFSSNNVSHIAFHNYADNNILQARGNLTLPIGPWANPAYTNPCISWRPDGLGNAQGGGFSAKGGKLTVNLYGDGRTLPWYRPILDGNSEQLEANSFCGGNDSQQFSLMLGGSESDSELEFKNGIDFRGGRLRIKAMNPASINGYAVMSGPIVNSYPTGVVWKVSQISNGAEAAGGTIYLTGTNTYTNLTVVAAGKLIVTPSHLGAGPIVATNGGVFGVRITATNSVKASALTLGSGLGGETNRQGGLAFEYALASSTAPLSATNFTVNVAGTNLSTIQVSGALALGQIPLVKYTGAIGGAGYAGLKLGALPAGYSGSLVNNTGNSSVDLNVTAVPTPPTITITNIAVNGTTVTIGFTGGVGDVPANFTLQRSATVNTGYADDTGASIIGTAPAFQATTTTSGGTQFYGIRRP